MRKFVVSDLHGDGNVYYSIMNYLENLSKESEEEIVLYINGDLIDRGPASVEMLLDIKDRIVNNKGFKVVYLAGNHELMMHQASLEMNDKHCWPVNSNWFWGNGGAVTAYGLEDNTSLEEELDTIKFVSNLHIYEKLEEKLSGKQIVIVHAQCPMEVKDTCDLTVKDNTKEVEDYLWTRKYDQWTGEEARIGNPKYFAIVGHTPVDNSFGVEFDPLENCLNIDGGCAQYVSGYIDYDHEPLVEIDAKNNRLIILTFNHENKIVRGSYLKNGQISIMKEKDLQHYRKYLSSDVKLRKLVYEDDLSYYEE